MRAAIVIAFVYVLLLSEAWSTGAREWYVWLALVSVGLLGFGLGRASASTDSQPAAPVR